MCCYIYHYIVPPAVNDVSVCFNYTGNGITTLYIIWTVRYIMHHVYPLSVHPSIHPSLLIHHSSIIYLSIYLLNLSVIYPFVYLFLHPFIHPSIYPIVYCPLIPFSSPVQLLFLIQQ